MKIRVAAGAVTIIAVLIAGLAPGWVLHGVVQVPYTFGKTISYQELVTCQGEITAATVQDVVIPSNVVMQEVSVSVGDTVQKGDQLATVDRSSTQLVWRGMDGSQIKEETEELQGEVAGKDELSQELAAWAQKYGLSAEEISSYLQQTQSGSSEELADTALSDLPESYTAPLSGTVLQVSVSTGQLTQETGVIRIADLSSLMVTAQVPENQIQQVQVGDTAKVTNPQAETSTTATVKKIHPSVQEVWDGDQLKKVVLVELELEQPDASFLVGSDVQVEIAVGEEQTYYSVPYEAIRQDEDGQEYLYRLEGCHPIRTPISTGVELENCVQVLGDGLEGQAILYDPDQIEGESTMVRPGEEVQWDG